VVINLHFLIALNFFKVQCSKSEFQISKFHHRLGKKNKKTKKKKSSNVLKGYNGELLQSVQATCSGDS